MITKAIAVLILAGAIYAFAYEDESKLVGPTENPFIPGILPLKPENVTTEDIPLSAGNVPLAPGNVPFKPDSFSEDSLIKNEPLPVEVTGEGYKDGSKLEGTDLKTDATFWWPFYRSFHRYPYYRYYRPRVYYRYYYW
ncbi:uncharacterized protein [Choristoneura fumiferana]|uniref:uncharacterized protein n=1 Tax=Choristoneura fumiferana TaxID=7141 RepID=UPI003D15DE11